MLDFAAIFLDLTIQCAESIEPALISNAIEKNHKKFKNFNVDVEMRCNNNRLLYLMPDSFHSTHMEQLLADQSKLSSLSQFFKQRILARIASIQVLVTGNTNEEAAKAFCTDHVLSKLPIMETDKIESKLLVTKTSGDS